MMMDKVMIFEEFAAKASRIIEEKKKRRTKVLTNKELGIEIEIRGLSNEEIIECSEYSEVSSLVDKYTAYYASKTLKELASYMLERGQIKTHLEVMEIFNTQDIKYLVNQILELSGINDKTGFSEVDELKNY